ncbi:PAS domain S-box-containing protein [Methylobacter tundripaludum]|uniref:histidine kinase n=1 Tax=Methylobacter tundripaludum TaxID=173365 RepID=A0A2S6HBQ3_9GAMM|nr:PAS domain S-box protein [Methylobacter tundripaludum]PPK74890.1 PAS domain S-box-containing protein [Methylobacter tundripaludum]
MLDLFFLNSLTDMTLAYDRSYNIPMVIVSVLIAIFASFCSLEMVDRLARGDQRYLWLSIGALILGGGVWAMHFIGMLAFQLDCEVTYDPWITGLSVLPGIFAAAVALNIVTSKKVTLNKLLLSGIVMASGIGLMHYSGMAAIRLDGILRYNLNLFILSLAAAVCLSVAALSIKTFLSGLTGITSSFVSSLMGGSVLGGAISSMHYIAMEAAYFVHTQANGDARVIAATSPNVLAIAVICIAVLLIFSGLMFTYLGMKIAHVRTRINAILASTNQGFVMMDRDGIITECNQAMVSLMSTDKQSLVGTFYRDLISTDNNSVMQANYRMEARLKRPDGSLLPCLIDSNSITDDSGERMYSFALFSDISERIADETELRESETQFRALLESTPDPMVILNSYGLIGIVNHQAEDLLGYSKNELLGEPIDILLTDESHHIFAKLRENYIGNAQARPVGKQQELRVKTKEGRGIPVEVSFSPINTSKGLLIAAALRDISQRKMAESALARSEIKFRTLYVSTSEAVMLWDERGFFDCNDATLAIFGCATKEEFYTKQPSDFSPPQQPCGRNSSDCSKELIAKALEQGSHSFEWLHRRIDNGKYFSAEVVLSSMELDGKLVLLGTVRDITDRKQYEEKLLQLAEAKSQLLQSEKMATIGQLAAGVAHELNNPIAFVYSNLGTFESYVKDILEITAACQTGLHHDDLANVIALQAEKNFEYLKSDIFELITESKDGITRMRKIVEDLKNFSRVGEPDWQSADLQKGLESTLNIVWNELKYKCLVTKNYSDDLPQIRCIASQLNQVFMNLLVNAGHAIERKGEITITTRVCPSDNTAIQVLIADTGAGIPPENLKRIFDPFFTTKPVGQGTGLGLSITWGIIAKHHGTIEVDSTVGVGSTFTITLPVDQYDA